MNYEVNKSSGKWEIYPDGNSDKNQQSKIFKMLIGGMKITRHDSLMWAGCYKLPTRISEINDALYDLMGGGFSVKFEKLPTKHNGYVYRYFLTGEQIKAINEQFEVVA